jgi:hypothetical protein
MNATNIVKRRRAPPLYIVLTAIAAGVNAIISLLGAISFPIVPGITALYPAVILMAVFSLWFGGWGIVAAALGGIIGTTMSGFPLLLALVSSSVSDGTKGLIPCLVFKGLHANPALKTRRDTYVWILAVLLEPIPGGLWGVSVMYWIGWIPSMAAWAIAVVVWIVGEWILLFVIGTPLLKLGTPIVDRMGLRLFPERWW